MSSPIGRVDAVETVLSQVFLTDDRAYKVLKPIKTSFVDLTDRTSRLDAVNREFALNHRICPDVYLGVSDIVEHDEVADRMIVMKRLPNERQLDRLVDHADFGDQIRETARAIATFHAGQPPVLGPAARPASVDALRRNWTDNFETLEPLAGPLIDEADYRLVETLATQYMAGRETLFSERIEQGLVRDGHGDLRCEHVFCLDDKPRLIDCLAFRDDFRISDVLNDVAFLAMDLHRLAGPQYAKWLIDSYDEFFNEHHPSSLAHHYVAYRAHVRAKVASIRLVQGDRDSVTEVLQYHNLALEHLRVAQPKLILVGGGPGVGKSTVASALSERLGVAWLRSDEIRKNLAGMGQNEHAFAEPDAGIYSPGFSLAVYQEMMNQADLLLRRGESVIMDASWSDEEHRAAARRLGTATASPVIELRCVAADGVARERIARRMASIYNPSDAEPELVAHVAERFDRWPTAIEVRTDGPIGRSVDAAMAGVAGVRQRPGADSTTVVHIDTAGVTIEAIGFFLSRTARLFHGESGHQDNG